MFGVHVPSALCLGSKLEDMSGTTCEVLLLNSSWVAVRGFPGKRDGRVADADAGVQSALYTACKIKE